MEYNTSVTSAKEPYQSLLCLAPDVLFQEEKHIMHFVESGVQEVGETHIKWY